jgi:predicted lipid-binding transport protein (Tim44 family)
MDNRSAGSTVGDFLAAGILGYLSALVAALFGGILIGLALLLIIALVSGIVAAVTR